MMWENVPLVIILATLLSFSVCIVQKVNSIHKQMEKLMSKLDDLQAAVGRNESAEDSVIVLLRGVVQQLKDAQGDPAKIDALIAQMDASTEKLAAAVVENTPVPPPVEPPADPA